jgi:50S ribosomal protein L16 3-hydroxylase
MKSWDSAFDKSYWKAFAKGHWDKSPAVISGVKNSPFASSDSIMEGLFQVAENYRKTRSGVSFYVDKGLLVDKYEITRVLPDRSGLTFKDYAAQTTEKLQGREFGIQIVNFQSHMGLDFLFRVKNFLNGLFQILGVSLGSVEVELFMGTYSKTPFGVHKDKANIFCFPIEGAKSMRVWPDKIFKGMAVPPTDYSTYMSNSKLLKGEVGDILTWPSSYWHVGETTSGPSLSLSLAVYNDGLRNFVQQSLEKNIRQALRGGNSPHEGEKVVHFPMRSQVPIKIKRMSQEIIKSVDVSQASLDELWLNHVTGHGIRKLSGPWPVVGELRDEDRVVVEKHFPILFLEGGARITISANGRSFTLPRDIKLKRVINKLNRGEPLLVGQLIQSAMGRSKKPTAADQTRVKKFLGILLAYGGARKLDSR